MSKSSKICVSLASLALIGITFKSNVYAQTSISNKVGIDNLNIIDDYIYYQECKDGIGWRISRLKKDGSQKPEVVFYDKSIKGYVEMQVVGKDIYFSTKDGLYKLNKIGEKPTEILSNKELNGEFVKFLIKDGWVYCWGCDAYNTTTKIGLYKVKLDKSEKVCIIDDKTFKDMGSSDINIDGNVIYYYTQSYSVGKTYTSDLNGGNLKQIEGLNNLPKINAFDGYMYYSYSGKIYRIKSNGSIDSIRIMAKDASDRNYNMDILDVQLWYYNSNGEISKVSLNK